MWASGRPVTGGMFRYTSRKLAEPRRRGRVACHPAPHQRRRGAHRSCVRGPWIKAHAPFASRNAARAVRTGAPAPRRQPSPASARAAAKAMRSGGRIGGTARATVHRIPGPEHVADEEQHHVADDEVGEAENEAERAVVHHGSEDQLEGQFGVVDHVLGQQLEGLHGAGGQRDENRGGGPVVGAAGPSKTARYRCAPAKTCA